MLPVQSFVLLFNNLAISDKYLGVPSRSRLDCARLCYQQHHCSSFFYNSLSNFCSTNRRVLRDRFLKHTEGVTYYAKSVDIPTGKHSKKKCPRHWGSFPVGNSCFRYIKEEKSWAKSQENCMGLGGNLAKVSSTQKRTRMRTIYVRNMVTITSSSSRAFWLGGHRSSSNGTWKWADKSSVKLSMWRAGQPEDGFCCMDMYFDGWNDDNCTSEQASVCEKII